MRVLPPIAFCVQRQPSTDAPMVLLYPSHFKRHQLSVIFKVKPAGIQLRLFPAFAAHVSATIQNAAGEPTTSTPVMSGLTATGSDVVDTVDASTGVFSLPNEWISMATNCPASTLQSLLTASTAGSAFAGHGGALRPLPLLLTGEDIAAPEGAQPKPWMDQLNGTRLRMLKDIRDAVAEAARRAATGSLSPPPSQLAVSTPLPPAAAPPAYPIAPLWPTSVVPPAAQSAASEVPPRKAPRTATLDQPHRALPDALGGAAVPPPPLTSPPAPVGGAVATNSRRGAAVTAPPLMSSVPPAANGATAADATSAPTELPFTCPRCHATLPGANRTLHEIQCRSRKEKCKLCNEVLDSMAMAAHVHDMHATQKCALCGDDVRVTLAAEHDASSCRRRLVRCMYGCSASATAGGVAYDSLRHHEELCGNEKVPCSTCKELVRRALLFSGAHDDDCPAHLVRCRMCREDVLREQLPRHIVQCGSQTEQCGKCLRRLLRRDIDEHRAQCLGPPALTSPAPTVVTGGSSAPQFRTAVLSLPSRPPAVASEPPRAAESTPPLRPSASALPAASLATMFRGHDEGPSTAAPGGTASRQQDAKTTPPAHAVDVGGRPKPATPSSASAGARGGGASSRQPVPKKLMTMPATVSGRTAPSSGPSSGSTAAPPAPTAASVTSATSGRLAPGRQPTSPDALPRVASASSLPMPSGDDRVATGRGSTLASLIDDEPYMDTRNDSVIAAELAAKDRAAALAEDRRLAEQLAREIGGTPATMSRHTDASPPWPSRGGRGVGSSGTARLFETQASRNAATSQRIAQGIDRSQRATADDGSARLARAMAAAAVMHRASDPPARHGPSDPDDTHARPGESDEEFAQRLARAEFS